MLVGSGNKLTNLLSHGKKSHSPKPTSGGDRGNKHGRISCRAKPRTIENYAPGHVLEYELYVTGPQ